MSFAFAALLCLALWLSSTLQLRNQEKVLLSLGDKVMSAEVYDVQRSLLNFLYIPEQSNKIMAGLIETMQLKPVDDLSMLDAPLRITFEQTLREKTALSVIGFGSMSGSFIALRRAEQSSTFNLMLKDARTQQQLHIYPGLQADTPNARIDNYDPRTRPWFLPVIQQRSMLWSDIYSNIDEKQAVTISNSLPVFDAQQQLVGVLVSDIRIDQFNQLLLKQVNLGTGAIFILDQDARLIAHSSMDSVLSSGSTATQPGQRQLASESKNPLIRAASSQLQQDDHFSFYNNKDRIYARIVPLTHPGGINWRIVVLIPEKDLVGALRHEQRLTTLFILFIGLGIAILGWFVLGRITHPIISTAQAAEKLGQADWQAIPTPRIQLRETALLTHTFNDMAAKLALSFKQLNRQIRFDAMTGLMNRNGLAVAVNDWSFAPADQQLMLLIGLDGYRAINDSVGHALGDALLQSIAVRLQQHVPANALLARTAGAEFTILMSEINSNDDAIHTTLRYLAYFSEAFQAAESADEVLVTASIGVVHGHFAPSNLNEWLRNSSVALGKAKAKGFGSYTLFEEAMVEQSIARTRLMTELRLALEREEFRVYFQPVIDLQNGETIGAEALIRWESPRGMISPGVFIPAAEDSGLILQIGNWVLRESCQQIANKLQAGWRNDFDIHVNVSVRQLIQSDFYEQLQQILQETGLPAHNLTLEITESCLVTQSELVASLIKRVRLLGVGIAIDDFGTGYSSLAYLHQFDFDYLKIDQSFIARMLENLQDEAIVAAIINMAAGFKVILVGEGIETEAQANRLRELGCQRVQGYYFGRPIPLADWPELKTAPQLNT
ncbi:bifunctional diguanylate cyclase/phosphodiesterase [Deefgea rivuli]|uniref:bifunctional diguanylate cyclase/phosphodiesterase n=1 Tax=Deefgea rivuli TaxID=400948 RepID=UPI000687C4B2|nr:EAL domain-containing protein [Deefgea rivuli]